MKFSFLKILAVFALVGCGTEYNVEHPFCQQGFKLAYVSGKTALYQGSKSGDCQKLIGNQVTTNADLLYSSKVTAKDQLDLGVTSIEVIDSSTALLQVKVTYANPVATKPGETVNRKGSDMLSATDNVEKLAPDKIVVWVNRK